MCNIACDDNLLISACIHALPQYVNPDSQRAGRLKTQLDYTLEGEQKMARFGLARDLFVIQGTDCRQRQTDERERERVTINSVEE